MYRAYNWTADAALSAGSFTKRLLSGVGANLKSVPIFRSAVINGGSGTNPIQFLNTYSAACKSSEAISRLTTDSLYETWYSSVRAAYHRLRWAIPYSVVVQITHG